MDLLQVLTYLVWLVGSVTFILALKFLASPATARRGNQLGAAGMALIILWTFFTVDGMLANWWILLVGGLVGSGDRRAGRAPRADDRHAADGRHLQRRRRRRARRWSPSPSSCATPASTPASCRCPS